MLEVQSAEFHRQSSCLMPTIKIQQRKSIGFSAWQSPWNAHFLSNDSLGASSGRLHDLNLSRQILLL